MDAKANGAMPANPVSADFEKNTLESGWGSFGLTKREAFAMAAMKGLSAWSHPEPEAWAVNGVARRAVQFADALLIALSQEPQ